MAGRVRVFIACSLDGFIAGVDHDLSWLPPPSPDGDDHGWADFIGSIGALLMGSRTYDVVRTFDTSTWPYGERPVLVATTQQREPIRPSVRFVRGTIREIVDEAKRAAAGGDVYIDGGDLIRQALDAGLIDELTVTFIPVVLGAGLPLFAGVKRRTAFDVVARRASGELMQLTLVPKTR